MRCVEGQNDALDAIRALQYEGTKTEVAQGFKNQGNEMVAEKSWVDAKEFYSKGLAVLNDRSEGKWGEPEYPEADAELVKQLKEQIYANRALANLELSKFIFLHMLSFWLIKSRELPLCHARLC